MSFSQQLYILLQKFPSNNLILSRSIKDSMQKMLQISFKSLNILISANLVKTVLKIKVFTQLHPLL